MKKSILLCVAFTLASLLLLVACGKTQENKVSIAILTPTSHPSLEKIERGFIETMEAANPGRYSFQIYNALGNKTLMRSEIEDIIQQSNSLVFTIGTMASQMTAHTFSKKGVNTPIVFTCVNDPVAFNIVESEKRPGQNITGVKELLNFQEELRLLSRYKQPKTLLLVYNPEEPGLQKDKEEISRLLEEKEIAFIPVEVFRTNEILTKASPFMDKADVVVVLKDNTVVAGLDVLVKLCNRYCVPLMASDLDSPDKGAAFGYGVYEREFGVEAAYRALLILEQKINPGDIPVEAVSQFAFLVNEEAARQQGIDVSLINSDEVQR